MANPLLTPNPANPSDNLLESQFESSAFRITEIDRGLYLCKEKFFESDVAVNIWILQGSERDLIIDPGIGLWDLKGFLKASGIIGSKPFDAVATHMHFDHSGGLHQFHCFSIHRLEANAITEGDNYAAAVNFIAGTRIRNTPPGWKYKDYKLTRVCPTRVLEDGDLIDLGDKKLEVLHVPGHTPGSIALFERNSKLLFVGDMLVQYRSSFLDILPYSDVTEYAQSCRKLLSIAQDVERVCPGHFEVFDGSILASRAREYISGNTKCYRAKTGCLRGIFSTILRGRNTRHLPSNCCYYACCCCFCNN